MTAHAAELSRTAVVVEGHRDCYEQIYWHNMREENPVRDRLAKRLEAGSVDVVIYAIGGDTIAHSEGRDHRLLATMNNLDVLRVARSTMNPPAYLVRNAADLPEKPDGRLRFLLHLEGGMPLEGSLAVLEALFELGLRSMQPTWNVRNELADGVHERGTGSGLTRFGVAIVRRMQALGMLIDLSHIAESGFWHVMRTIDQPVFVTHANSRAIYDHPRNLTDEQARAIGDSGGVIGVHTLPTFIGSGQPSIDNLIDHVLHLAEVAGIEHVGFGGDFVSCDGPRPAREALFHDPREAPPTLDGLREADDLHNFTRALLRRGLGDEEVTGVLGGNFLRAMRSVLP